MFLIDDALHAEPQGEFGSIEEAMERLKEWATIAWDQPPNRAPCKGWRNCGPAYEIVEYNDGQVLSRITILSMSRAGAKWLAVRDDSASDAT